MSDEAMQVMQQWRDGINQGEFEKVIGLYHDGASLLPTFSSDIKTAPAGVREYFENVAKADSVTVTFRDDSIVVEDLTEHCSVISGLYDWEITKDEVAKVIYARFTCIIDTGKAAPLLHQHSSVVPES